MKNVVLVPLLLICSVLTAAQTTEFSYQGRFTDGSVPANGTYDFEFRLFDAPTGGTLLGTVVRSGVPVSNGSFTVLLGFGPQFTGGFRFLEILVRPAGSPGGYQQLLPRHYITSVPYAMRTLNSANADKLGGMAANEFVLSIDPRLNNARQPLPDSPHYIQNSNIEQANTNFNISGSGRLGGSLSADSVNSATDLKIAGTPIVRAQSNSTSVGFFSGVPGVDKRNSFFGYLAGNSNTIGAFNSYFGASAGTNGTSGLANSFFGFGAGSQNTEGSRNSFLGYAAGSDVTTGNDNAYFGNQSGTSNVQGIQNSFFGSKSGWFSEGSNNVFIGYQSGSNSTTGFFNVFVGTFAGNTNTTGGSNTIIGNSADVASGALTFATAIGASAVVSTSNTIALGRSNGSDKVRIFGLGSAGGTPLCRNANNEISTCSSPLRDQGDGPSAADIEELKREVERQKLLIRSLQQAVCRQDPNISVCKEEEK